MCQVKSLREVGLFVWRTINFFSLHVQVKNVSILNIWIQIVFSRKIYPRLILDATKERRPFLQQAASMQQQTKSMTCAQARRALSILQTKPCQRRIADGNFENYSHSRMLSVNATDPSMLTASVLGFENGNMPWQQVPCWWLRSACMKHAVNNQGMQSHWLPLIWWLQLEALTREVCLVTHSCCSCCVMLWEQVLFHHTNHSLWQNQCLFLNAGVAWNSHSIQSENHPCLLPALKTKWPWWGTGSRIQPW